MSGSFLVGDYVVDQTGTFWICTAAGSPGTWAEVVGTPGGTAGGDLTGTYPNPTIGANKVTTAKLATAVTVDAIATANATAADVAMNSHKLTGLSAGSAAGHSIRYEQLFGIGAGFPQFIYPSQTPPYTHTGDSNNTVLATFPIAAGAMGANGMILCFASFHRNGSGTSSVTLRQYFGASGSGTGGTAICNGSGGTTLTTAQLSGVGMASVANSNSASGQVWSNNTFFAPFTQVAATANTGSINTANAAELNLAAQLATNSDSITLDWAVALLFTHS